MGIGKDYQGRVLIRDGRTGIKGIREASQQITFAGQEESCVKNRGLNFQQSSRSKSEITSLNFADRFAIYPA